MCGRTQEEHDINVETFKGIKEKYNLTLNDDKTILSATSISILGYTISNNKSSPDYNRFKPLLEMPPPTSLKSQKRIVGMFSYYSKFIKNFSDKMYVLNRNTTFPVPPPVLEAFKVLKNDLKDAALQSINYDESLDVETDASDFCIAATLNQRGRPVAFLSRTLNPNEIRHHAAEKEAAAIVEAVKQWRHFLLGRHFKLITDQKSISYMYDNERKSKIKNDKISRWRVELSQYKFDIIYRPGKDNVAADTFSRIAAIAHPLQELHELHENLCHPGITRLSHFVRAKNLPFTQDEVKRETSSYRSCLFLKPQFLHSQGTLIKALSVKCDIFAFNEVTFQEIEQELRNLDTKKATTFNNIPPKHLKENYDICSRNIMQLINETIIDCDFPNELKLANITPIHKCGEKIYQKNYRPVRILPVISKIYERVMQQQINSFVGNCLSPFMCKGRDIIPNMFL